MEQLVMISIYFMEAVKYIFGYELLTTQKLSNKWIYTIMVILLSAAVFLFLHLNADCVHNLVCVGIIGLMVLLEGKSIWENMKHVVILVIFLRAIDGIVNMAFEVLGQQNFIGRGWKPWTHVLQMFLVVAAVAVRTVWGQRHGRKIRSYKTVTYLMTIMLTVIVITNLMLNWGDGDIPNMSLEQVMPWINLVFYFCIILLVYVLLYINSCILELSREKHVEQKLYDMKEHYYKRVLKKEDSTRQFRHDMLNHFVVLRKLQSENQTQAAQRYLEELTGDLKQIRDLNIYLGNPVLDIITNYYLSQLPEEIPYQVTGILSGEIDATDKQLCTVLGNLMANAVEAIQRIYNNPSYAMIQGDLLLAVQFEQGRDYLRITIRNSVAGRVYISPQNEVGTCKKDVSRHGHGIRITQSVVEQINGQLKLQCDDYFFTAVLILRMKHDESV